MAEYTPSMDTIKRAYVENAFIYEPSKGQDSLAPYKAQFDRALAAHDARVRRDAARRALSDLASEMDTVRNNPAPWVRRYRDTHYPETED